MNLWLETRTLLIFFPWGTETHRGATSISHNKKANLLPEHLQPSQRKTNQITVEDDADKDSTLLMEWRDETKLQDSQVLHIWFGFKFCELPT